MIPHAVIVLDRPVASIDEVLMRVPEDRRFRLVFGWSGVAARPPFDCIRTARAGGFRRVRLSVGTEGIEDFTLQDVVNAGVNEVSVPIEGPAPWRRIGDLRREGRLAFVSLVVTETLPAGPGRNPCGADECVIDLRARHGEALQRPPAWLSDAVADRRFRKVSIRGMPLCAVVGLDPDRVLSNAWEVRHSLNAAVVPFEVPGREYREACATCRLAAACDGFSVTPETAAIRVRPPTVLSGRAPVLGVLTGARNCGRFVVSRDQVGRQTAMLRRLGLHVAVVDPRRTLRDGDPGAGSDGCELFHLYYSRDLLVAKAAAAMEYRFAARGKSAGWAEFTAGMGRLLGYPDCCIAAFLSAGPSASLSALVRMAARRSQRFDGRLAMLDALSPFVLVPHVPCRFDCGPSLWMADRVLAALPSLFPYLDGTAAAALARPVLFLDARRNVSFQGESEGGGIRYTTVDSPTFRPGAGRDETFIRTWLPALMSGNRIEVSGRHVRVRSGARMVAALEADADPVILPFGGERALASR